MKTLTALKMVSSLFVGCGILIACGDDSAPAHTSSTSPTLSQIRDTYELVTVHRPTSIDDYVNLLSMPYKMCRALARAKNLPVKPFPVIPENFVMTRTTIISDGKSFRTTEEGFGVDIDGVTPENGCETKFGGGSNTWVAHNGFEYVLDDQTQSQAESERVKYEAKPYDPESVSGYSISKKINNIAVKCTDESDLMVAGKIVAEMCVLDPKLGRIAMSDGKPPIVYSRDLPGKSVFGSPMILEPVSLRVGIKVSPTIFVNASAK
ncbi:hypothetical protein [Massilia aquatica]|uniref:Lipoprotein n=1 Tax=Massilia aquatica TaxID=2609000 RepID=A0ABX0LZE4_9BURK|nr:hypothetical protein [Massilia aquatica]NHZ39803.1 hypothetical protein [Massilia aquatica]